MNYCVTKFTKKDIDKENLNDELFELLMDVLEHVENKQGSIRISQIREERPEGLLIGYKAEIE